MLNESNLYNYQTFTKNHIIDNPVCGLLIDMGLGKTIATLTAINWLMYEDLQIDKVLVVAPKKVVETTWPDEIANWEHTRHIKYSRVIGNAAQRKAALVERADIYLISRDNIAWLVGLYGGSKLPFDMLVIDESSSFKNHKSLRFKALKKVQPCFDRVVILTGTPVPNGLIDLWSQVYLLDRGERLGKTITEYRNDYFRPNQRRGNVIFNYKIISNGEALIYEQIGDICISMKKKDYLDLPGVVYNTISIDLGKKLKKDYEEFEHEQVLELLGSEDDLTNISAVNAAALSNKLLQFASGTIYDEERKAHKVHDLKVEAVKEYVEALNGKPAIIFYSFKHNVPRILKALKEYEPVVFKKAQHVKDWNEGKIKVMLMHPASGGHGLNLQKGGVNALWYGPTWSLEYYQQANARLDRQGKIGVTIVHHLIVKGTIEEDVIAALDRKDSTQKSLMQAVKAKAKKYLK